MPGTVATVVAPTAHEHRPGGIVTPEAVVLEFAEAGLGSRTLGFLVDLGVRLAIMWAVLTGLGFGAPVLGDTVIIIAMTISVTGVLLVYPVVCETIWNGRTVGKMLVGLRVVTVEGAPVRFRHAAIRSALGLVDFLATAGSAAIFCALATRRSQRLGDLVAGTIVVRERQAGSHAQPIIFQPPPGWEAYVGALDVSGLDDELYVLARSFLLRVHEMRTSARYERGMELATLVGARINAEVPTQHHPETFLHAVAAVYQARNGGLQPPPPLPGGFGPGVSGGGPAPVWQEEQPAPTWGSAPPPS